MWKEIEARIRKQLEKNDREAIVLLHQHLYKEMLHSGLRTCLDRELVKDAIHDVLLGVWSRRKALHHVGNLKGYLLICLRNNLLRRIARENRYCRIDETDTLAFHHEISAESMLLRAEQDTELRKRVAAALNKLTPRQRQIIRLRYFEEHNIAHIAQLTAMETKTVYNTLYMAMKVLGAELSVCMQHG